MKKILSTIVFVIICGIFNFCSAYDYDSNYNYKFIANISGHKYYLYLPSLDVQEYNPPHYQIAGRFISPNSNTYEIDLDFEKVTKYNWYTKETFHKNIYGNWAKDDLTVSGRYRIEMILFANALFRAAYGMDFYVKGVDY